MNAQESLRLYSSTLFLLFVMVWKMYVQVILLHYDESNFIYYNVKFVKISVKLHRPKFSVHQDDPLKLYVGILSMIKKLYKAYKIGPFYTLAYSRCGT